MEAIEIRQREHGKEKRILVEQNKELNDVVRALKVSFVYIHLTAVLLGAVSVGLSQDHLNENSLHAQYFIDMDMRGEKFIPLLTERMWMTFLEGWDIYPFFH